MNNFSFKKNTNCRICNNNVLKTYLDLGAQPPSNSFVDKDELKYEKFFSLKVQLCENCGLSQLDTIVSPDDVFKDYMYLSSTSRALVNHYTSMTKKITSTIQPENNDLIVDIGSNDGITLETYEKNKFQLLGIEPSSAAEVAQKKGIKTEKNFFTYDFSKRLIKKYGQAKIITTTNVFAHIENIRDFTKGIKNFLDPEGVFIIEFPYLGNMLEEKLFDVIYHEHLSYLSILPLNKLFSDLSSLNILQLNKLKKDYTNVGYSLTNINIHIQKLLSYPIYLMVMTIFASVIMLNIKRNKSKLFHIVLGVLLSVLIYYINYFSSLLGQNERLPETMSIWLPLIIISLFCTMGLVRINEK